MESMEVEMLVWFRKTMATERLSDLAFIAMYGDRSVVCGKFVALHPRRMTAASLLLDDESFSSILWRSKALQCYSLQFVLP